MSHGPWCCTCLDVVRGCEKCIEGMVRCERPNCAAEAIIEKNGQRLCVLCSRDKKGMVTVV